MLGLIKTQEKNNQVHNASVDISHCTSAVISKFLPIYYTLLITQGHVVFAVNFLGKVVKDGTTNTPLH